MSVEEPIILYVEDDPLSRKVMEMMIRLVMGYHKLTIFENSVDFMDRVAVLPEQPDLIFLDVQMGPVDGYAMLKMLRQSAQFTNSIVIAMTANVMSHDIDTLQQAGFNGLIGKPIMKEVVPDLVKRILAGEQVWYVP